MSERSFAPSQKPRNPQALPCCGFRRFRLDNCKDLVSVRRTHLPNSSFKGDGVRVFLSGLDWRCLRCRGRFTRHKVALRGVKSSSRFRNARFGAISALCERLSLAGCCLSSPTAMGSSLLIVVTKRTGQLRCNRWSDATQLTGQWSAIRHQASELSEIDGKSGSMLSNVS